MHQYIIHDIFLTLLFHKPHSTKYHSLQMQKQLGRRRADCTELMDQLLRSFDATCILPTGYMTTKRDSSLHPFIVRDLSHLSHLSSCVPRHIHQNICNTLATQLAAHTMLASLQSRCSPFQFHLQLIHAPLSTLLGPSFLVRTLGHGFDRRDNLIESRVRSVYGTNGAVR
jgi:hypothetical protein